MFPRRVLPLFLLLAVLSVGEGARVFNKVDTSAESAVAVGRKLKGCKKTFANPLFQPILAYNNIRARGPQLILPSTGWYDLADVALTGNWDKVIQSINVGGGAIALLWKDKLSGGANAKSPPLALGEGYKPTMPRGWAKAARTVYALRLQSKEPAFPTNLGNLIGALRDGYGKDATPPKLNLQLLSAADNYAGYLFRVNKLTDVGPKGAVTLADRLKNAGYGKYKAATQLILRVKTQDPARIFNVLTSNAKYLKAMLGDYTEIGTGWGWNGDSKRSIYLTIVLARK